MRNLLTVAAVTTMVFVSMETTTVDAYAATKNARAMALRDCEREARAKRFGSRTIQRRNFLKDCMIDRGFYADVN
jgi:hypothetical protein